MTNMQEMLEVVDENDNVALKHFSKFLKIKLVIIRRGRI